MKSGEHPPKGVKELVLKLAGSKPRPTNREIVEAVQRKFRVDIVERTVARYCKAAGLPTSSRQLQASAGYLNQGTAQHDSHIDELVTLAKEMRRHLVVPSPFDATAWYTQLGIRVMGWGLPGLPCPSIEGFTLSEEHQALVPFLRAHMDDAGFWANLEAVGEKAVKYCYDLWSWIEVVVNDAYEATRLPLLQPGQVGVAGLTEEFFDEVFRLAAVVNGGNPLSNLWPPYEQGRTDSDIAELTIGRIRRRAIAWAPADDHERLIEVHKGLVVRMAGQPIRTLWESHTRVETVLKKLRARLLPGMVRPEVAQGRCE